MSSRRRKAETDRKRYEQTGICPTCGDGMPGLVKMEAPPVDEVILTLAPAIKSFLQRVGKVAGETKNEDTRFELEQALTKFHAESGWAKYDKKTAAPNPTTSAPKT